MSLFSRKKKTKAGLLIDRGMFRYLAIDGVVGDFSVAEHIAGVLPISSDYDGDPFARAGANLEPCFAEIAKQIPDLKIPISLSLPTSDFLLRIVNMPGMSAAEAKLAFRYEFENYFPFPVEEGIFDLAQIEYPLPNNAVDKRFLVAATRLSMVENIIKYAEMYGFTVAAIEPAQIAIERAVTPMVSLSNASVYVYAGRNRSVLILSWKGNGVFYRSMSIGFDNLIENHDASSAAAPQYVAFAKEVRSSLQFALSQIRGFETHEIYISGPGASSELCDTLADLLAVEKITNTDCLKLHGLDFENNDRNWEIPIGLALR